MDIIRHHESGICFQLLHMRQLPELGKAVKNLLHIKCFHPVEAEILDVETR